MENSNDLTTCKTCGGTISKSATTCPHCGAKNPTLSADSKKKIGIFVFLVVFISFILILVIALNGGGEGASSKITLSEFDQIKTGMSYSQVCEIIGGKGELMSSVDLDIGSEYATQLYTWEGNGYTGSNANVTFQGGKVVSKAQIGLK